MEPTAAIPHEPTLVLAPQRGRRAASHRASSSSAPEGAKRALEPGQGVALEDELAPCVQAPAAAAELGRRDLHLLDGSREDLARLAHPLHVSDRRALERCRAQVGERLIDLPREPHGASATYSPASTTSECDQAPTSRALSVGAVSL